MTVNTEDLKREGIAEEEMNETEAETAAEAEAGAETADGEKEVQEEQSKEEVQGEESGKQEDADRKYLRLMADFQNYKRRVEKEKRDLYSYANEKIMGELLEVMDNFERALEQSANDSGTGLMEGMEMIFKQLSDVLEKEGLKEIEALGEDFDPNVHNAVMTEETEEYESGKVSGVMQKGYTLNGKVIRPSMVKVVS